MKKIVLFLVAAWSLSSMCASAQSAARELSSRQKEVLLAQLGTNLRKFTTIQTKFTQEKHLALFKDVLRSEGLFAFSAPDRLRWEVLKPFHSLLLMNGRQVSKYDYPDGQNPRQIKFPAADALGAVLSQIADMHQGKFAAEEKNYDIEIHQGRSVTMILVPKNPRMKQVIQRIEIGFSSELDRIASVIIRENEGDYTRIVFAEDRRNLHLPDGLFSSP
jgi:outer membrane lipoprotein-sorting protein